MENLSFNTRKSLCNQLGDVAGTELAEFLLQLKGRLEKMERNKVDRMPVVPDSPSHVARPLSTRTKAFPPPPRPGRLNPGEQSARQRADLPCGKADRLGNYLTTGISRVDARARRHNPAFPRLRVGKTVRVMMVTIRRSMVHWWRLLWAVCLGALLCWKWPRVTRFIRRTNARHDAPPGTWLDPSWTNPEECEVPEAGRTGWLAHMLPYYRRRHVDLGEPLRNTSWLNRPQLRWLVSGRAHSEARWRMTWISNQAYTQACGLVTISAIIGAPSCGLD